MAKYKKEVIIAIALILFLIIASNSIFRYNTKMNKIMLEKQTKVKIEKWQGINTWSFGDTFNYMYTKHGLGYIFEWRNNKYKIILKEGKENGR